MLTAFSGVESEMTVYKFRKIKINFGTRFTYSLKRVREVRKFHVSIVQQWLINLQKSMIHVQSCCFANTKIVLVIKNTKYFFAVLKREKR